jgi:hypothetical protein
MSVKSEREKVQCAGVCTTAGSTEQLEEFGATIPETGNMSLLEVDHISSTGVHENLRNLDLSSRVGGARNTHGRDEKWVQNFG